MAMIELKYSLNSGGKSLMVMPDDDENTCGLRDTSKTVACLVMNHAPGAETLSKSPENSIPG